MPEVVSAFLSIELWYDPSSADKFAMENGRWSAMTDANGKPAHSRFAPTPAYPAHAGRAEYAKPTILNLQTPFAAGVTPKRDFKGLRPFSDQSSTRGPAWLALILPLRPWHNIGLSGGGAGREPGCTAAARLASQVWL
jgi:hypothetical protein